MTISIKELFKGLFRLCECKCGILIPCVNKMGEFSKYKKGHNIRGKPKPKGSNSSSWNGGKSNRYRYVIIYKPYFKYSNKNGYVSEHRYIMYIYLSILNNKITYIEGLDVHHKDKNPKNNKIENLELINNYEHGLIHNPIIDKSNWFCNLCGSKTTRKILRKRNGKYYDHWYNDIDGHLCHYCYDYLRRY